MIKNYYSFNCHFGIDSSKTEYLDILLESDIKAFLCPYIIKNNIEHDIAKKIVRRSTGFLKTLTNKYVIPNNKKEGIEFLTHLREANEYRMGYSSVNVGKGVGGLKAEEIYNYFSKSKFVQKGVSITDEAHNVLLLVSGIGQDLMGDILSNICRDIFAEYTLEQCRKHVIPLDSLKKFKIEFFNESTSKWESKTVLLPTYNGKKIILTPQYLCSMPRLYQNLYNWHVVSHFYAPDIISGQIKIDSNKDFIVKRKNGETVAKIKKMYHYYRQPKDQLHLHVLRYDKSLLEFQLYAKDHYLSINDDQVFDLWKSAA